MSSSPLAILSSGMAFFSLVVIVELEFREIVDFWTGSLERFGTLVSLYPLIFIYSL